MPLPEFENVDAAAVDAMAKADQPNSLNVQSPVDGARLVAGMVLSEAVHLGEINPAMARRFGERMDQVFNAAMRGAQVGFGARGEIVIKWPEEPVNVLRNPEHGPSRDRLAQLQSSTAVQAVEGGSE